MGTAEDWQDELRRWLGPFLSHLGHKARRRMCPLYVAGLIGPGGRKSVQPMASRTPAAEYDQLHHFVGAGIWDEAPLERELIVRADRLVGARMRCSSLTTRRCRRRASIRLGWRRNMRPCWASRRTARPWCR